MAVVDEPPAMLELPASIANPQLAQAYNMFKDGTDSQSVSNMAAISQSIGSMLTEKGDDASYAFFKQSAAKLREAEKLGAEIPAEAKGSVFYNETCALARDGETDAAMKSLGEAISFGFNDFDRVRSDTDLKNLQVLDNFKAKLGEWEIAAVERQKKEVAELLANNDAFDFDFNLKDIDGNEQSLEGLKGKVVIVDLWATSCVPCMKEFPHLVELSKKHPKKLVCVSFSCDFYGVASKPPSYYRPRVEKFLKSKKATFKNFISTTPSDDLFEKIKLASIPAVLVFGPDGKLAKRFDNDDIKDDEDPFSYKKQINPLVEKLVKKVTLKK